MGNIVLRHYRHLMIDGVVKRHIRARSYIVWAKI